MLRWKLQRNWKEEGIFAAGRPANVILDALELAEELLKQIHLDAEYEKQKAEDLAEKSVANDAV